MIIAFGYSFLLPKTLRMSAERNKASTTCPLCAQMHSFTPFGAGVLVISFADDLVSVSNGHKIMFLVVGLRDFETTDWASYRPISLESFSRVASRPRQRKMNSTAGRRKGDSGPLGARLEV